MSEDRPEGGSRSWRVFIIGTGNRKRKFRLTAAAAALLSAVLLLTACSAGTDPGSEETSGYKVYYLDSSGTRLQEVSYLPVAQTFDELMGELEERLADSTGLYPSALRDGVKMQGYQRGIDALRIDFSSEYYQLDNVAEVLLRAAVIKTFSQVPGVQRIMITVDGEQLMDEKGEPVPAMDGESFIDTREGGINSYQYATISLYFPENASQLVPERRSLQYSSNMVLENVVLEELIKGPKDKELLTVFDPETRVNSVQIGNGECQIDLNAAAGQIPAGTEAAPETVLYALVNSICETCDGVDSVRLSIDGDQTALFRGEIPLDQEFKADLSLVKGENSTVTYGAPPIGVDPSLAQDSRQDNP